MLTSYFKKLSHHHAWPVYVTPLLYVLAAIYSTGFYHWDEHFQILEFLSYFKGNVSGELLPWEFSHQMRSWVQPLFYYLLQWPLSFLKIENPFYHVLLFKLVTGFLSLIALKSVFDWTKKEFSENDQKVYQYIACFLWFLPMLHTRHSSEAFAGGLFAVATVIFFHQTNRFKIFFSGFLFTVAIYARFQMGVPILSLVLWVLFLGQDKVKRLLLLFLGFVVAFSLCTAIDSLAYGELVFTPWNYFYENIVLDQASRFGRSPWFDYLKQVFNRSFMPIGLMIIISVFYFWRKNLKHPLTWMTLSFVLIHQLVSHKELRFLFPLTFFVPYFLTYCYSNFSQLVANYKKIGHTLVTLNFLLLIVYTVKPLHPSYNLYRYLYQHEIKSVYFQKAHHPFRLADLPTSYFKRPYLETKSLEETTPPNEQHFVFNPHGRYLEQYLTNENCTLAYSSYPQFVVKSTTFRPYIKKHKVWTLFTCSPS